MLKQVQSASTRLDQRQRVGGLQIDDLAARDHRSRFGDRDRLRRRCPRPRRACAASPAAAAAGPRRGRRSAPRRRSPASGYKLAQALDAASGTRPISSSHSRARGRLRRLAVVQAAGRQLPESRDRARARYCRISTTRPSSWIGISTTDGRCRTIATSCSRPFGKRAVLDLDREHAAFVDDRHAASSNGSTADRHGLRIVSRSSSSTRCRSSGSSLVNSIRRPSLGCLNDQPRGVQERPLEMRDRPQIAGHAAMDAAVQRIADDRVADRAQMHADLMRPAGVDRDLRQRQHAAEVLGADDPRHRLAAAPRARRHLLPVRRDRGRSARRSAARPAPRPRPARCIPSRPRGRETGAPAPRAPRRAWRPPSAPTCRDRADARCPGRFSPPMPLRSSTWWSSALTSVPLACPAAGWTTMPAGLSTTMRSRVLVDDRQRQRFGLRRRLDRLGHVDGDRLAGLRPAGSAFASRPSTRTWPSLISRWICDRECSGSTETRKRSSRTPSLSSGTVNVRDVTPPLLRARLRRRALARAPGRPA